MKKIFLSLTLILFVIPFGISQDLPSYVPADGLVAFYPFNGNANDESGNGHHGTVNGATLTSDRNDVQNSSYSFDGLDDYIYINSNNNQLDFFGNCCLTISAWINLDNTDNQYGILTNSASNNIHQQYALKVDSNSKLYFLAGDGLFESNGFNYSSSDINNGQWTHTLVSYDGNKLKLYLNGNLDYENQIIDNFPESPSSVAFIGNSWGSNNDFFPGQIDDVGIWNRALTEKEIQNLYNSSTGDIKLNGVVSAENNQIRNVADPTHTQDAVTLGLLLEKISNLQDQIDALQSTSGSGTVTDQDGNSYPYLTYGDQVWTVKNAEMVTYRDGTPIPQVTDAIEWANLTTGAWCYYDNDPSKGKLYNWYAVAGIHDNDENTPNKELAPEGWHVPTDAEWTELENYLIANGYNYDGTTTGNKIAKAMSSTTGWNGSTTDGVPGNNQLENNSSGFNAFPDGGRISDGTFRDENKTTIFWTSSEKDTTDAWDYDIDSFNNYLARSGGVKEYGSSVRFVRD